MGLGNGMKEKRDDQQSAGGEVNEGCLIAKNVLRTAVVIMAHSEYVQYHIVMIDTVHSGNQVPQCPS